MILYKRLASHLISKKNVKKAACTIIRMMILNI